MKRAMAEENGDAKRSFVGKQEGLPYGYEAFVSYASTTSSTTTSVNQPLPGQPPLPPMPPPQGAVPPPPQVFVPSQVTQMPTWPHPPPPWQWITQSTAALSPQTAPNFQRGNFPRRERFNNRNNIYNQRSNFHRNKNIRRIQRFEAPSGPFHPTYFGTPLPGNVALDWQRNNFPPTGSEGIMGHVPINMPNQINHLNSAVANRRTDDDFVNKVTEDVIVKKSKQRKPMSLSYPSRVWNREDAERALKIENEYSKKVKAQSLIIKFPDPDLNKDIVREFHPGIQNIHFQSPSGPRYCFIQMADTVNIDEAIQQLEKIAFGVGHLKVERKSLRDDDNPTPEEIDPYTLYVGNLPESVNVNEVKSKFPTATRVDVGYAQKMRNTRYAFMRYNSVEDSIKAYREAHNLMWDTRSIIVRFRRQRGNTCLPGEQKNVKEVKDETVKNEECLMKGVKDLLGEGEQKNVKEVKDETVKNEECLTKGVKDLLGEGEADNESRDPRLNKRPSISLSPPPSDQNTISPLKNTQNGSAESDVTTVMDISSTNGEEREDTLWLEIKAEPEDYDSEELDMLMDEDDEDDEQIEEDEEEEPDDDDDEDFEEEINENLVSKNMTETSLPADGLDKIFSDLDNITEDIAI